MSETTHPIKIVVWDSIGNTLLGVRPWASWSPHITRVLLREDAAGPEHAPSFQNILADIPVELTWFTSATAMLPAFGALADDFAGSFRPLRDLDELATEIADADYLVVHKERLPDDVLRHATRLKLLQHLGQDYRGLPVETARAMGIPVTATPLVNYLAVAEHVWALILQHLKQLRSQGERMRQRGYDAETWGTHPDVKLARDQTLGLLGFGEIARPIAEAARAFGMRTIYWDIERFPDLDERYGVSFAEWDDLFRQADVLSVQLALNDQTEGIIGAREIGLMRPDALFINTARGKLVDQAALTAALAAGQIGGAALDVFAEEPLPADDPLHALHERTEANVTLTPHSAWQSPWTWVRDSHELWYNVLRSERGEPIAHLV